MRGQPARIGLRQATTTSASGTSQSVSYIAMLSRPSADFLQASASPSAPDSSSTPTVTNTTPPVLLLNSRAPQDTGSSSGPPSSAPDSSSAPTVTSATLVLLLNSRAPQDTGSSSPSPSPTDSSSTGAGSTDSSSDTPSTHSSTTTPSPPPSTTPPPSSTTLDPSPTSDSSTSSSPAQSPSSTDSSPSSESNTTSSSPPLPSSSDPTSQAPSTTPVPFTTFTSSFVTTVSGTVSTIFPSSLNSPDPSDSSSQNRTGVIVGSAVGATVVALVVIGGLFLFYRRRRHTQRRGYALPIHRSSFAADDEDSDQAGKPTLPRLLPSRGAETGSLFHEEVWPPPRSRLEDPILAGSNVDLHSIVDEVMGPEHARWSSSDTMAPLLATAVASSSGNQRRRRSIGPSEAASHSRQLSSDSPSSRLPPGAAAPANARGQTVSSTGSPRFTLPNFGSLMVVNRSPTEEENSMPLVDLTPDPSKEIPPLYHTIRRDTVGTSGTIQSEYSQPSAAEDQYVVESRRTTKDSDMLGEPLSATSTIGRAI